MTSGVIATPQSTAATMRSTRIAPLSTVTSATDATKVPKDSQAAIPRPLPDGMGEPHPAFSAASRTCEPVWPGGSGGGGECLSYQNSDECGGWVVSSLRKKLLVSA